MAGIHVIYPSVDGDMRAGIIVNGALTTYSQEGGFGADEIMLDEITMSEIIAKLFRVDLDARGSLGASRNFGQVRLTIEIVSSKE